jgi:hypothetical protein
MPARDSVEDFKARNRVRKMGFRRSGFF